MDCIFCKIAEKKIPADIVYEDEKIIAFKDINPKAPLHILIIPKKHIASVKELKVEDKGLMGELIWAVQKVANDQKLGGYKLIINIGREGGQIVDHLHLHLLGGKVAELP